eukprot:TRINITY_DN29103_c0_g1_i1.p1 TRINITY_DN29103_c0_g1~~TRINITY_DN29103_c0_g1_i1.p1  ORF type:complete len:221 (+),score=18.06 TRINITY_DN29103_c0_g1_i1:65-727(+)
MPPRWNARASLFLVAATLSAPSVEASCHGSSDCNWNGYCTPSKMQYGICICDAGYRGADCSIREVQPTEDPVDIDELPALVLMQIVALLCPSIFICICGCCLAACCNRNNSVYDAPRHPGQGGPSNPYWQNTQSRPGQVAATNPYWQNTQPAAQPLAATTAARPLVADVEMPSTTRTMQVECPAGVQPGQLVEITSPEGQVVQVSVPAGIQPGSVFTCSY